MRPRHALLALLLTAGCAGATAGTPSPPPPPASVTATGFNGTDVAWLQLMAAMNERALLLLDLAADQGGDPAVRALAVRLREGHRDELRLLREILDRTGLPATNVHEGHDMPGMVSPDELTVIGATRGPRFDRHFLRAMREHVLQSTHVSLGEQRSGAQADTTALAATIARARAIQREQIQRALTGSVSP